MTRMTIAIEPLVTATAVDEGEARRRADTYLTNTVGLAYGTGHCYLRDGRWCFMVTYQGHDLDRTAVVGVIAVDAATALVAPLTDDQIRNLQEAGAVQAAQARGELARDQQGYVLRYHARIKAGVWISDRIDLKVGANGGAFLPLDPPVWRFSIDLNSADRHLDPLGVIDVDAKTGQVLPLTPDQLQQLRECVRAAKQRSALAPAT
jgi:hypothetical protein